MLLAEGKKWTDFTDAEEDEVNTVIRATTRTGIASP